MPNEDPLTPGARAAVENDEYAQPQPRPRPPSTTPVETLNRCGVGVKGHGDRARIVLTLLANAQTLTAPQACELAAWLVVMADAVSISADWAVRTNFDAEQHFAKTLTAILTA